MAVGLLLSLHTGALRGLQMIRCNLQVFIARCKKLACTTAMADVLSLTLPIMPLCGLGAIHYQGLLLCVARTVARTVGCCCTNSWLLLHKQLAAVARTVGCCCTNSWLLLHEQLAAVEPVISRLARTGNVERTHGRSLFAVGFT